MLYHALSERRGLQILGRRSSPQMHCERFVDTESDCNLEALHSCEKVLVCVVGKVVVQVQFEEVNDVKLDEEKWAKVMGGDMQRGVT